MGRKIFWAFLLLACFAAVSTYAINGDKVEKANTNFPKSKSEDLKEMYKGENDYWAASLTESGDPSMYTLSLNSKHLGEHPDALTFTLSQSVQSFAEFTLKANPFPSKMTFSISKESIKEQENHPVVVKVSGKNTSQYFQMHALK